MKTEVQQVRLNKFFVYGTLKVGGEFAKQFDGYRKSVEKAKLIGYDMFKVNTMSPIGFPAAVAGNGIIIGEVHTFPKEYIPEIIRAMDYIECYNKRNEGNSLYLRKQLPVELNNGYTELAYVYLYRTDTAKFDKVESGVWEIDNEKSKRM